MRTLAALRAAVTVLAFSAAGAQATVEYEQLPITQPRTAWTSHFGIGQGGFQMMDDFRLNHDAVINHVSWNGTYFDNTGGAMHGGALNTDTWTIQFWSGNAAGPSQQLYNQDYAAGNAVRKDMGALNVGGITFERYGFDLDLTLAFDVIAGQSYWFSVMSKSSAFNPVFSWLEGAGPGNSWQRIFDGNGRVLDSSARAGNRAFTLESNTVPEPGSLALVVGALLAGGMVRRVRARTGPAIA